MEIRDAVESDFEEITAIYNEVLTHSTAIYNDQPTTVEERLAWWRARQQQGFPVLVATEGRRGQGICDVWRFSFLARLSIHGGRYHPHSRFCSWTGHRQGFAGGTDSSRHRPGQTYDDRRGGLREPGIHPIFTARRICAGRASARGRIQIRPIS